MGADLLVFNEAERNHGIVTRSATRALGVSDRVLDRMVAKGILERRHPHTFAVKTFPVTFEQRCAAALAWLGDEAVVHGVSSAHLLRLPGNWDSRSVHVWTSRGSRSRGGVVVHRLTRGRTVARRYHRGISIVSAEQMFLDVASMLGPRRARMVLDETLRTRMTTLDRIGHHLAGWHGHGAAAARQVFVERSALPERLDSWLEKEFALFVRRFSLPMPLTQQRLVDGSRCVARVDFLYPWANLVIEVDGFATHGRKEVWQRDLRRGNELVLRKLRTLRYTADDLRERASAMAQEIRAALAAAERSA